MTVAPVPARWRGAVGTARPKTFEILARRLGHVLRKPSRRQQAARRTESVESMIEALAVCNHIDRKDTWFLSHAANRHAPPIRASNCDAGA